LARKLWIIQVKSYKILAYVDLRRIENARRISEIIASSKNTFLLDSNNLNLNMNSFNIKK
jgi:hypothetical protein